MKIETYKCDICGQMCSPTNELYVNELGYRTFAKIIIHVEDKYGNELDVCKKDLLVALNKALGEDK